MYSVAAAAAVVVVVVVLRSSSSSSSNSVNRRGREKKNKKASSPLSLLLSLSLSLRSALSFWLLGGATVLALLAAARCWLLLHPLLHPLPAAPAAARLHCCFLRLFSRPLLDSCCPNGRPRPQSVQSQKSWPTACMRPGLMLCTDPVGIPGSLRGHLAVGGG